MGPWTLKYAYKHAGVYWPSNALDNRIRFALAKQPFDKIKLMPIIIIKWFLKAWSIVGGVEGTLPLPLSLMWLRYRLYRHCIAHTESRENKILPTIIQ